MKHIRKFESYRVKKHRDEIIKESVLQVNDIYKVKTMIDIPQSLINAYVKKVKETTGKNLRQFFGDFDVAEEIVKFITLNYLDVDKIPGGALMGGGQTQAQGQGGQMQMDTMQGQAQAQPMQGQAQGQSQPMQGQAQAQPMQGQAQAQPMQGQAQTQGQPAAQGAAQGAPEVQVQTAQGQGFEEPAQVQAQSQKQAQGQGQSQDQGQEQDEEEGEEELPL